MGGRPHQRERLEAEAHRPGPAALAEDQVRDPVLERRVEALLAEIVQPVDLIDQDELAFPETAQERDQLIGIADVGMAEQTPAPSISCTVMVRAPARINSAMNLGSISMRPSLVSAQPFHPALSGPRWRITSAEFFGVLFSGAFSGPSSTT